MKGSERNIVWVSFTISWLVLGIVISNGVFMGMALGSLYGYVACYSHIKFK